MLLSGLDIDVGKEGLPFPPLVPGAATEVAAGLLVAQGVDVIKKLPATLVVDALLPISLRLAVEIEIGLAGSAMDNPIVLAPQRGDHVNREIPRLAEQFLGMKMPLGQFVLIVTAMMGHAEAGNVIPREEGGVRHRANRRHRESPRENPSFSGQGIERRGVHERVAITPPVGPLVVHKNP